MSGMKMDEKANEKAAVHDMTPGHSDAHSLHMTMTAMRTQSPEDVQRANEIVEQLKAGIEKYKDYHVALNDGFKIFLPNIPQPEYHFTSYRNGFLEAFTFDPARPTSLLYKKTGTGYELVGAMYTMPKRATEDQLNARVPLSVAMWHLHSNLCMPPRDQLRSADWTKFGLKARSPRKKPAMPPVGGFDRPFLDGWCTSIPTEIHSTRSTPCTTWTKPRSRKSRFSCGLTKTFRTPRIGQSGCLLRAHPNVHTYVRVSISTGRGPRQEDRDRRRHPQPSQTNPRDAGDLGGHKRIAPWSWVRVGRRDEVRGSSRVR